MKSIEKVIKQKSRFMSSKKYFFLLSKEKYFIYIQKIKIIFFL